MKNFDMHPSPDDLELYSMRRASDEQEQEIEEHLLVCETCRSALDAVEEEIRLLRVALGAAVN
jgi:predicted anti-sigma-YlaC factor YlaD